MKYPFLCGTNGSLVGPSPLYQSPIPVTAAWQATESDVHVGMPMAGTFRNMAVRIGANEASTWGAGDGYDFTLRKNGVNTALKVSLLGLDDVVGYDLTNSVTFVAGDIFSIRSDNVGGHGAHPHAYGITFECEPDTVGRFWLVGANSKGTGGSTTDGPVYGINAGGVLEQFRMRFYVPGDGTIRGFRVELTTAPGAGETAEFQILKNGVLQAGSTLTISGTDTVDSVAGLSIDLAPEDFLMIEQRRPTGSQTATDVFVGVEVEPDIDGESWVGTSPSVSLSTSTRVASLHGIKNGNGWLTYATFEEIAQALVVPTDDWALVVRGLLGAVDDAPGGSATRTFRIGFLDESDTTQKNGTQSAVILGADTVEQDTVNSDTFSQGDAITLTTEGADGPANSRTSAFVALFIAPAAPAPAFAPVFQGFTGQDLYHAIQIFEAATSTGGTGPDGGPRFLAALTNWIRFRYTKRVNAYGDFQLDIALDDERVQFLRDNPDVILMVHRKDDRTDPANPLPWYVDFEGFGRTPTRRIEEDQTKVFTLRGWDFTHLLWRRMIAYGALSAETDKDAPAETVIKAFVNENLGALATLANGRARDGQFPDFTVEADGARGAVWTGEKAWRKLGPVLQEIAAQATMYFRVLGAGELGLATIPSFQFRAQPDQLGLDRTHRNIDPVTGLNGAGNRPVVFEIGRGNMGRPRFTIERDDEVTVAIAIGQGPEGARDFEVVETADALDSPWNDIEASAQANDLFDPDALTTAANELLGERAKREVFTFRPIQTAGAIYGRDYVLGDRVTVVWDEVLRHLMISTVTVAVETGGQAQRLYEDITVGVEELPR